MPIDPIASALDAVAAHFDGLMVGSVALRARRGWPEHEQDLDLANGPVLSVSAAGRATAERCSPRAVDQVAEDGEVLVTYRVGYLTLTLQLDLWAPYRATRDDFAAEVEAAAVNHLPHTSRLRLTSSGYYGRPLTVDLGDPLPQDDGGSVAAGEWRHTWFATVDTDLVAQATHPQLVESAFSTVVTERGIELTEPTQTFTP